MPNYTTTAVLTVAVAVGGAEATRLAKARDGADNPGTVMGPVLGGFTLGLFLFAAGMASEYLATLLCILIALSSLLLNGQNLFTLLPHQ